MMEERGLSDERPRYDETEDSSSVMEDKEGADAGEDGDLEAELLAALEARAPEFEQQARAELAELTAGGAMAEAEDLRRQLSVKEKQVRANARMQS